MFGIGYTFAFPASSQIDSSSKDTADWEDSQRQHPEDCSAAVVQAVTRQHLDAAAFAIVVARALQPKVLDYRPVVVVAADTSSAVAVAYGDCAAAADAVTVAFAYADVVCAFDDVSVNRRGADYQGRQVRCPGGPPQPLEVCNSRRQLVSRDVHLALAYGPCDPFLSSAMSTYSRTCHRDCRAPAVVDSRPRF